ncbi:outer membrane protein assembly factor BamE domain-containing protein [Hyalangium sp.]|uniref:outer membrane protein assembly factor BamE domain-containing protein n=1 Tax=Hyalangium sp. TaxID=2028555 RepID=UPI002D4084D6|nr:outer membrane protein assembly factor BamE [Hyalangium sp.]HYH96813.1 outer membrane protein assembly factor BamE [Hyalangium sp.]
MKAVLITAAALTLSACIATGKKVTQEQVSQFQKGKTTYQEVITGLGKPTGSTLHSDGSRSINYSYAQSQASAASFIPYVGRLVGGSESEHTSVYLTFDKNGILTDFSATSGQTSTGTGLLSGQRQ